MTSSYNDLKLLDSPARPHGPSGGHASPDAAASSPMSGPFGVRAKKAEVLKFSSRGPLRSAACSPADGTTRHAPTSISCSLVDAAADGSNGAASGSPHHGNHSYSQNRSVSASQLEAIGTLNVGAPIAKSGRATPRGIDYGNSNTSASARRLLPQNGSSGSPSTLGTPRAGANHRGAGDRSTSPQRIFSEALPTYGRSPARNAAPPLTAQQQQNAALVAKVNAASRRTPNTSAAPSRGVSPNTSAMHAHNIASSSTAVTANTRSVTQQSNAHYASSSVAGGHYGGGGGRHSGSASVSASAGVARRLSVSNVDLEDGVIYDFEDEDDEEFDPVTLKYDPIALLINGEAKHQQNLKRQQRLREQRKRQQLKEERLAREQQRAQQQQQSANASLTHMTSDSRPIATLLRPAATTSASQQRRASSSNTNNSTAVVSAARSRSNNNSSAAVMNPNNVSGASYAASQQQHPQPRSISPATAHILYGQPALVPKENIAMRTRRSASAARERIIRDERAMLGTMNKGNISATLREMRRSVSPTTVGLSMSCFGLAAASPTANLNTASPLRGVGNGGPSSPFSTRNGRLRAAPFGGELAADQSAAATNTTVSSTTPLTSPRRGNGTPRSSRRVATPRGTVVTCDFGSSLAYARDATAAPQPSSNAAAASNVDHDYDDGGEADKHVDPNAGGDSPAPVAAPLRGAYAPQSARNTFTPSGKRYGKGLAEETERALERQQQQRSASGSAGGTAANRSGSVSVASAGVAAPVVVAAAVEEEEAHEAAPVAHHQDDEDEGAFESLPAEEAKAEEISPAGEAGVEAPSVAEEAVEEEEATCMDAQQEKPAEDVDVSVAEDAEEAATAAENAPGAEEAEAVPTQEPSSTYLEEMAEEY